MTSINEMDAITSAERNALVGFCENCVEWKHFTNKGKTNRCATCGELYSRRIGLQVTTQRTFDKDRGQKELKKFLKVKK